MNHLKTRHPIGDDQYMTRNNTKMKIIYWMEIVFTTSQTSTNKYNYLLIWRYCSYSLGLPSSIGTGMAVRRILKIVKWAIFYLATRFTLHWNRLAWRQAAQWSLLYKFPVSWDLRVSVERTAVNINFSLTKFNPLNKKLFYIRTRRVTCSKHSPPQLYKTSLLTM